MVILKVLVLLMTTQLFAKVDQWEKFNSSLLIEVTRPNGVFTCTGVAVSPKVLLTAAHCLSGEIKKIRVFTQEKYDPKLPSFESASFEVHPGYNPNKSQYQNDIAKIILKETLPSSIIIHPVFKEQYLLGDLYRFGFGERGKKNIRTVITPKFRVIKTQEGILELDDTFSRSGDSGGPIFVEKDGVIKLVAIHSTFSHGPQGRFSYNPMVNAYLPWIFPN
jgi:V8-like Glu-specific endopeptidase